MSLVVLLLAACGGNVDTGVAGTDEQPDPGSTTTSLVVDTTMTVAEEMTEDTTPADASPVAAQAQADLAERLAVPAEEIKTESVETGFWIDGSIGCPEPGMMYTQALVAGVRVTLSHQDQIYYYHQGGADQPFLCESPAEDSFRGAEGDELIPPPGYNQ